MKPCTSPYKHLFYNQNRVRPKSGGKLKKSIERFVDILKKQDAQGDNKWIYKTKTQALSRLKKYGVSSAQINGALERKGLTHLSRYISQ